MYVNCYLKTTARKQQNTDSCLSLDANCDIMLLISFLALVAQGNRNCCMSHKAVREHGAESGPVENKQKRINWMAYKRGAVSKGPLIGSLNKAIIAY